MPTAPATQIATPIPTHTVEPTVVLYAPGPAGWSADTTIALIGVIVALLGAVATGLLAWLALQQTAKATRLEQAAQERAERLAMASAIDEFLSGWKPTWSIHGRNVDRDAIRALRTSAAGISSGAQSIAEWVIDELNRTVDRFVEDHQTWGSSDAEGLMTITLGAAVNTLRRRVIAWVATGSMNQDALYSSAPPPPSFDRSRLLE